RADGTVDEAGGKGFFFSGAAFAFEEATGDLAGCVGLFLVVDGKGEEVLAGIGGFPADDSGENNGAADGDEYGASCLSGNPACFEYYCVIAVFEFFPDRIKHYLFLSV